MIYLPVLTKTSEGFVVLGYHIKGTVFYANRQGLAKKLPTDCIIPTSWRFNSHINFASNCLVPPDNSFFYFNKKIYYVTSRVGRGVASVLLFEDDKGGIIYHSQENYVVYSIQDVKKNSSV